MTVPFASQRILIWGAARSGLAAARLLAPHAAEIAISDDAPLDQVLARLSDLPEGVTVAGDGEMPRPMSEWDVLVVSPGVPAWHPAIEAARAADVPVLSELEVGARFVQGRIAAVTGTNGKTTTATLAAHLLGGEERDVFLAGNVGTALCDVVRRPEACTPWAVHVVEVSSFQCEHLEQFHPSIAAVLNLRADHLDRHGGLDGYVEAKSRLGVNLMDRDTVIVNADDERAQEVARKWRGRRLPFSLTKPLRPGISLDGDRIVLRDGEEETSLLFLDDLRLPGLHNVANAMAAAGIAHALARECQEIQQRVRTFRGVAHRIEWVANERGVDYYNDSKATNLDSMDTALASFQRPVVLIAGGRPKGEDYTLLRESITTKVKALILLGEAADTMAQAWEGCAPIQQVGDFGSAVEAARRAAEAGDVVLLSPGCASFDMFRDYEDRGERFRAVVHEVVKTGGSAA